jgi:hypothetical protein
MFKNILTKNQVDIVPLLKEFSRDYCLVGGTAIALQLGHRRSLDFDLFTSGRAKWKDYVDLYILLKDHFPLARISEKSKDLFEAYYNEKFFREQLCYFQDIDYSEKVDFVGQPVPDEQVREFLTTAATSPFG